MGILNESQYKQLYYLGLVATLDSQMLSNILVLSFHPLHEVVLWQSHNYIINLDLCHDLLHKEVLYEQNLTLVYLNGW